MLTDSKIRSAKSLVKLSQLTDSQGLYFTVLTSGTKRWYFRYRLGGKESRLAFDSYPQTMLAKAHADTILICLKLLSGLFI